MHVRSRQGELRVCDRKRYGRGFDHHYVSGISSGENEADYTALNTGLNGHARPVNVAAHQESCWFSREEWWVM